MSTNDVICRMTFATVVLTTAAVAAEVPDDAPLVRRTIERSLAVLQSKGFEWETKKCVSCHHGPWMMWTGYEARKHGFAVNEDSLEALRLNALKAYNEHPKLKPTSRDNLTEMTMNVVYVTFGVAARGKLDAEATRFMDRAAAHLLEHQQDDGSWRVLVRLKQKDGTTKTFLQPPLIDDDDVTTLLSLLVLTHRRPGGISEDVLKQSTAKGLRYLRVQPIGDRLQAVTLRIMLYQQIDDASALPSLVEELLSRQNDDGGWSQTEDLKSDALGTGQAMVALNAAGIPATHPTVETSRDFLLRTQREDGTWFVLSRASQAPEFSSYMGTAWATLGLLATLPEATTGAEPNPSRSQP